MGSRTKKKNIIEENGDTDIQICTSERCKSDDAPNKLECAECNRKVHFKCTRLPVYQLGLFLTKDYHYRKYRCANCVFLPESIRILCEEDLTTEDPVFTEEFQTEIQIHKTQIEHQKKQVVELEDKVQSLEQELTDQERTFNEAGNPEYDHQTKLESYIKNKLEMFGEKLLNELAINNKRLEEKVEHARVHGNTYADIVTNETNHNNDGKKTEEQPRTTKDFRKIMREAREAEVAEELEQKRRNRNVILHGVPEQDATDKDHARASDESYITYLFETLQLCPKYRSFTRLGSKGNNRSRPIKITLEYEEDKTTLMSRLVNLKENAYFKGLSVTDDYTQMQRQTIKEWIDKANVRNDQEEPNSLYTWKARGTPKNGMFLKRVQRRKTPREEVFQNTQAQ